MPKVELRLPKGKTKFMTFDEGTTAREMVREIKELTGGEFTLRLRTQGETTEDVIEPSLMDSIKLREGDTFFFTPNVEGGLRLAA